MTGLVCENDPNNGNGKSEKDLQRIKFLYSFYFFQAHLIAGTSQFDIHEYLQQM